MLTLLIVFGSHVALLRLTIALCRMDIKPQPGQFREKVAEGPRTRRQTSDSATLCLLFSTPEKPLPNEDQAVRANMQSAFSALCVRLCTTYCTWLNPAISNVMQGNACSRHLRPCCRAMRHSAEPKTSEL